MIFNSYINCKLKSASSTAIIKGSIKLPKFPDNYPSLQLNTTLITLNDGEYSTYTKLDGSFAFYNVGSGVHLLDVHSLHFSFSQVKIQLLDNAMDTPKCIEYVYPGSQKQAIPHPLQLTAHAQFQYFEKRPQFSFLFIFKNPMILMMIFGVGMMYIMPKMMENMDEEQKEQMKKQMDMQKDMQDPSKMLKQLWGDISGDSEVAQKKVKRDKTRRFKRE